jgi:hypothetical protein
MENYDSEWSPEDENEDEDEDSILPNGDDDEGDDGDENDNLTEDEEELMEMEEELLVKEALLEFSFKFSEYVREIDPELWKRAVDYAVTFTQVDGVEFFTEVDEGKTGTNNEPPNT